MEYTYEINSRYQTISVITIGDLITEKAVKMGLEVLSIAKKLKFKIVFDNRLSKNKISVGEAYNWFSRHFDNIDSEFRYIPTAYIANKEDWDFYSFFECTCNNKGIPIKAFRDENAAMKWIESLTARLNRN
jgi:hypothetical protein